MKFTYILGNPPYQQDSVGANESDTPLYHYFYDGAMELSDKVMLIHPARFLFNAGATPKAWNEKMLSDPHLKVIRYDENSEDVFPNTSIRGGSLSLIMTLQKITAPSECSAHILN